ncbi:hypothetical protein GCM10010411_76500 [Actinomadura fulvescens]|uniref:DUF3560 domain-containing protein n=1 Tax=Actinomadura fulvescens TaxID=46160 RepID=A0ABP6CTZ8_9ACTN
MTITLKHTRQHGTLAYGTCRGDGAGKILHRFNFRFSEWLPVDDQLGEPVFYLPHSRRRTADSWKLDQAKTALEEAGFTVEITVDNVTPATGFDDLENERYTRAEARATHYQDKASSADAESEAIRSRNKQTYDALNGTPILIGHYSERRHRKLLDRLWKREGKAWELYDRAKDWRAKADAAERFQHRRESAGTTQRRIARLEKRLRQIDKLMAGRDDILWDNPTEWPGPVDAQLEEYRHKGVPVTVLATKDNGDATRNVFVHFGVSEQYKAELTAEVVEITEEISYWEMVLEATGAKVYTKANISRGDFIKVSGRWLEVTKVNARSVTVPDRFTRDTPHIHTWDALAAAQRHPHTSTVPYDEIHGILTGTEAKERFPAAFAAPLEGGKPPRRTTAKRAKSYKLEYRGGHDCERWTLQVGPDRYSATWKTPPSWYGPPTPIDDPAPIVITKAAEWGRPDEPVTELTVPAGIRWREDVQNALHAWAEPWAAEQQANRTDTT